MVDIAQARYGVAVAERGVKLLEKIKRLVHLHSTRTSRGSARQNIITTRTKDRSPPAPPKVNSEDIWHKKELLREADLILLRVANNKAGSPALAKAAESEVQPKAISTAAHRRNPSTSTLNAIGEHDFAEFTRLAPPASRSASPEATHKYSSIRQSATSNTPLLNNSTGDSPRQSSECTLDSRIQYAPRHSLDNVTITAHQPLAPATTTDRFNADHLQPLSPGNLHGHSSSRDIVGDPTKHDTDDEEAFDDHSDEDFDEDVPSPGINAAFELSKSSGQQPIVDAERASRKGKGTSTNGGVRKSQRSMRNSNRSPRTKWVVKQDSNGKAVMVDVKSVEELSGGERLEWRCFFDAAGTRDNEGNLICRWHGNTLYSETHSHISTFHNLACPACYGRIKNREHYKVHRQNLQDREQELPQELTISCLQDQDPHGPSPLLVPTPKQLQQFFQKATPHEVDNLFLPRTEDSRLGCSERTWGVGFMTFSPGWTGPLPRPYRNLDSGELIPFTHEPLLYPNLQIFNNAQIDAHSAPLPADATTDSSSSTNGVLSPPALYDQFNTSSAPLLSTMSGEAFIFNPGNNTDVMVSSRQTAMPPSPVSVPIVAVNGVNGSTTPASSTPQVTFVQLKRLTRFLLDCGIHPHGLSTNNLISLINTLLKTPLRYNITMRHCGHNVTSGFPGHLDLDQQQRLIGFVSPRIPRTAEGIGSATSTVGHALDTAFDFLQTPSEWETRLGYGSDDLITLTDSMEFEEHVVILNALIDEDCSNPMVSNIVRQMLGHLRSPVIA